MMLYKHRKFDSLNDLTYYLNVLKIPKDHIIFVGIEYPDMDGFSTFGLIYFEESEG